MEYVIQKGDTLGIIAAKYLGSSSKYTDIVKANPQIKNPNLIEVGQTITIPNATMNIAAPTLPSVKPATKKDYPIEGTFISRTLDQLKGVFQNKTTLIIVGVGAVTIVGGLLYLTRKKKTVS